MGIKQEFVQIFQDNIKRPGAEALLQWLVSTDFFIAPASTKYHCAFEGGLALHSINVYKILKKRCDEYDAGKYSDETIAICGLLHDICKANFYSISTRNVKNERGSGSRDLIIPLRTNSLSVMGKNPYLSLNAVCALKKRKRWLFAGIWAALTNPQGRAALP